MPRPTIGKPIKKRAHPMTANAPKLISFVIPVKDEEASLRELYDRIAAEMRTLARPFEIIFIDDGSVDTSWRVIEELARENPDQVLACRFRKNSGKADALAAGFQAARGEIIFTLDADLQDDPKEIPRFLEKLAEGFDLVSGWKRTRHDPWHKVLPSRVFNALISRLLRVPLHDHNCGFKCYRREVVKAVNVYGEMHRMIPSLASIHGYRSTEIEVEHHARKFGHSKYGLKRFFRGFMDMQTVYFLKNYRERPLHFFGGQAGIALLAGGALFALSLLPWWGSALNGILTMIAIVLLVASAPLLAIGFLAEMILRGQVEKDRRPPIAEVLPARGFLAEAARPPAPISMMSDGPILLSQGDHCEERREHVLVADDDAVTRRMLRHYLEEAGFAVTEAADGTEALARVDDSTAVVLLDLNMTGHNDGVDCLRQLRKRHANVDIIVVSGGEEIDTAVQTMKLGAFDYILKPANPQQIIKTIRKAINFREIAAA